MKTEEFFQKYANLPLDVRYKILSMNELGHLTMSGIYNEIKRLEDKMRPLKIAEKRMLRIAEEFMPKLSTPPQSEEKTKQI